MEVNKDDSRGGRRKYWNVQERASIGVGLSCVVDASRLTPAHNPEFPPNFTTMGSKKKKET